MISGNWTSLILILSVSKMYDKNIDDALSCALCAGYLLLQNFKVVYKLILITRPATWNLFDKYTYPRVVLDEVGHR